jgi:hypothetical protein
MQTPDRIEEAIVRLTDNQERLQNNQEMQAETQRRMQNQMEVQAETQRRLQTNQEYMAETHRMMSENITRITETLANLAASEAESKQRHAEMDARFNILLQEIRASNRRIDNLEAQ